MRIEHASLDGTIIVTELTDEPLKAQPAEPAGASLESLAAALQVICERVGMTKVETDSLIRPPRSIDLPGRT